MDDLPLDLPDLEPGWVWLTGAGPGEPGLLTLLALRGLRQADAVVYDALVDERVLALARPDAVLEYAGKRGGKPSPSQADISHRLIRLAREGLVEAGVPFRIVPGVSSGIGGLAYAGIPLTHREVNSAVTFVTGHDVSGEVPAALDWGAIARGSPVIVLYMALTHLERIAARLIAGGRRPGEPVAIVSRAATNEQAVLESTLGACAADAAAHGIRPPCLVVVGDVVRLRAGLDWLGALSGRVLESDPLGTRRGRDTG